MIIQGFTPASIHAMIHLSKPTVRGANITATRARRHHRTSSLRGPSSRGTHLRIGEEEKGSGVSGARYAGRHADDAHRCPRCRRRGPTTLRQGSRSGTSPPLHATRGLALVVGKG